ncbi:23S rRNA (adenine(2503)-C(2))-methyltransferase RlmN [Caldisalinibacter kiritimatiensis]|uniref:Probable dual-specificity RNA methyltransferase RlmN n=1 Tax=Caldisalinibacter kiritimatiensis TaxID=1304284 RepID=R1AVU9_9FIRM|nr:23S rRNA (adenine(2503)-C(2))-methyltransferase RlmN [Caldisalinibacter kiritimatiensis]EOD01318.1 Ribosomal RNA large subunit methyltransferase N [Caldisalinibacter kiritimatiensis]
MSKIDLKSMSINQLKSLYIELGEKTFRAEQTFKWIHGKMIESIDDITVLSKKLRDKLNEKGKITNLKIVKRLDSKLDGTKKYLFALEDGNIIESVMMEYQHGISVCVSTQVGCKMGCTFCASTKDGLVRNLTAGEILDQIYQIQKDMDIKVSNIVLMGSGEPLDNYDNVLKFLEIIHHKHGQNVGYRHITLSTCGIVPKIYELAEENLPITLSISLHSPFQHSREEIMPIARKYSIKEIVDACKYYIEKTNRRITFEYTLIEGVNDSKKEALELSHILEGLLCHVNLIPLNPIKETQLSSTKISYVEEFKRILEKNKISVTVRRKMGGDINAACGQLRRDYLKNE